MNTAQRGHRGAQQIYSQALSQPRPDRVTVSSDNALIVQSDCSVLLEVHAPRAEEARAALAPFAELVKSPEHVHTYRLTPLSIWNARAAGMPAEKMVAALKEHARSPVPAGVEQEVVDLAARYGRVSIQDSEVCSSRHWLRLDTPPRIWPDT
jgi:hypothetical protein